MLVNCPILAVGIKVHINDCNTYQARLGFVAPASVKIMRAEIDDLDEPGRCTNNPEGFVQPQKNTIPSLLRALFTRGSTGRQ
ncbi:hypothetical protein B0D95_16105 [Cellvibrio sp. PSBB023]|nr:hypothetical protein B0D95_16105 [Cellvibrio sp. PSBB023]